MKKYTLFLVAPLKLMELRSELANVNSHKGQSIFLEVCGSVSSIKEFKEWTETTAPEDAPDFILIFDTTDTAINQAQAYIDMLEPLKSVRLKFESKMVLILPSEKENDVGLINEFIKLNVQNFYFVDDFHIQDILSWLFDTEKTLTDNQTYLSSDHLQRQAPKLKPEVITEIKTEVVVKEVIVKPKDYKKTILLTGHSKKGMSTIADILATVFSDMSIKTSVIDCSYNGLFKRKYWIEDQEYKDDVRIKKCKKHYDIFKVQIKDHGIIPQIINDYDLVIFDVEEIVHFARESKLAINDIVLIHDMDQDKVCFTHLLELFRIVPEKMKIVFNKYLNVGIPAQGLKDIIAFSSDYDDLPKNFMNEMETYTISFSQELMEERIKSAYTGREMKIPDNIYEEVAHIAGQIYQMEVQPDKPKKKIGGNLTGIFSRKK